MLFMLFTLDTSLACNVPARVILETPHLSTLRRVEVPLAPLGTLAGRAHEVALEAMGCPA